MCFFGEMEKLTTHIKRRYDFELKADVLFQNFILNDVMTFKQNKVYFHFKSITLILSFLVVHFTKLYYDEKSSI